MTRLLLIIGALVLLGLVVRNALRAAMKESTPGARPKRNPNLPPDRLVCGICGEAFDPEASGWICPKCRK